LTAAAEADVEDRRINAAVNRCATRKQPQRRVVRTLESRALSFDFHVTVEFSERPVQKRKAGLSTTQDRPRTDDLSPLEMTAMVVVFLNSEL
jgi:hypothetical protein